MPDSPMQGGLRIDISPSGGPTVDLLAAGDFCFPTTVGSHHLERQIDRLYDPRLLELCRAKDIALVNVECPLDSGGEPIVKCGPHVAASPATPQALKLAGFDVALLANNHILDYGPQAMFRTRDLCEEQGIKTVGIGRNLEEALQPLRTEIHGLELAIFVFAEEEFSCAGPTTPGAAKMEPALAGSAIRSVRDDVDILVVCAHGGNELYPAPSPRMLRWYRFFVDCGADAVIGNHPHIVQGTEVYKGAPIVYSLGNFVFPYLPRMAPCWYRSVVARMTLGRRTAHAVELYATEFACGPEGTSVELLDGEAAESYIKRLRRLNDIASNPQRVAALWQCFCRARAGDSLTRLKYSSGSARANMLQLGKLAAGSVSPHYLAMLPVEVLGRIATRPSVRRRDLANLSQMFRCPAHHEVMTTVLEMERNGGVPDPQAWTEYQDLMQSSYVNGATAGNDANV